MLPYELFISLRYLKAKRKQTFISIITFISILGVMLGVMALIVVLAVMNGFEHEMREKILGTNAHILLLRYGGGIKDYYGVVEKVEEVPGVRAAAPFIYAQVMLSSKGGVAGAVLRGIDPSYEGKVSRLPQNIKEGSISSLNRDAGGRLPGIILGRELAKNVGVFLDDPVNVISPLGDVTPLGMTPRVKRFRVTGIFESGMFDYDSTLAYISLPNAQKFLRIGDVATAIEIKVKDIYKARAIAKRVEGELGFPYKTRDWMEMNKNLFSALRMEKRVMFILLSLIIGVAAFNIICTLIMVVMEKNRDIAILKSMGAKRRSIMKIFVFEGLIVGLVGTFVGSVLGLLIACNMEGISNFVERLFGFKILPGDVYYISQLPSRVDSSDVIIVVCVAIGISLLATIYPAWKASSLDPAEALRYE
ncbi:MAG: lipoprotein-releasing ABC transporter permease subunit [Deltaproteobacteria bacterium]|nr:lipoprotein-releasing ABC transporter permease subunit [Deltaproteobacteria bacterium]